MKIQTQKIQKPELINTVSELDAKQLEVVIGGIYGMDGPFMHLGNKAAAGGVYDPSSPHYIPVPH